MEIPSDFKRRICRLRGEQGAVWVERLPELVTDLAERWSITIGPPFDLSYNFVARAWRQDGSEAVFKVGPWDDDVGREIEALRVYDGAGICQILEADLAANALLLERLRPGRRLADIACEDDDAATRIGAELMQKLWRPAPELPDRDRFRPLAEWFEAFPRHRAAYGGPGPFPARVLESAEAVTRDLLASATDEVLLHADFHHYNVLSGTRAPWLAIDPKGMLGDPGYEIGPFLQNPDPAGPAKSADLLRRRLDILSDILRYDWQRLRDWGLAYAVLSACWSAEDDGDGWQSAIQSAEHLISLNRM